MAISDTERLKAWVRAGGRCEFCGNYLLEGKLTYKDFTLGELAHIVGRDVAPGAPRGMDPLPEDKRDLADNLMLLCRGEHNEIDRKGSLDLMTVERLRTIKREREAWIRRMTGLSPQNGTAVIRLIGPVRGYEVELTKPTAAEAVIRSEGRFPDFPLSLHGDGFEIDLRNVIGEGSPSRPTGNSASGRSIGFLNVDSPKHCARTPCNTSASSASRVCRCSSTSARASTTPLPSLSTNGTAVQKPGTGPTTRRPARASPLPHRRPPAGRRGGSPGTQHLRLNPG